MSMILLIPMQKNGPKKKRGVYIHQEKKRHLKDYTQGLNLQTAKRRVVAAPKWCLIIKEGKKIFKIATKGQPLFFWVGKASKKYLISY